jgi:ABC-type sugar transport system ATPase subunit
MASITVEDVTIRYERSVLDRYSKRENRSQDTDAGGATPDTAPDQGPTLALDHCNLEVADGETLAIVGPSGCGKSTLLRVIAGLILPGSGRVLYDGVDQQDTPPKDRGIGMVFQNFALYPHRESRENLAFFFRMHKREQEIPERVRVTAEVMGLGFDQLLARKPPTLSGGQQQRVAIARCIVRDPKLFLFDEPLSNLDAKLRMQTRIEIKRLLHRYSITSLYVTHDQKEAIALGDRIAVMRHGKVEQVASYAEIYERPANAHVAGFLGPYPMNVFRARLQGDRLCAHGQELPLPAGRDRLGDRQEVLVGIRPEQIEVAAEGPLRLSVEVVEPHLSERVQLVYCTWGSERLAARLPEELHIQPGDTLTLNVPAAALHLFDAQTQVRL